MDLIQNGFVVFLSKTVSFVLGNNMIGLFRLLPITSDCSMGVTHDGAREANQKAHTTFSYNLSYKKVLYLELRELCELLSVALLL